MCRIGWLILVGLACSVSAPGNAAIYKCKGPHGKIVYRDTPCADTSRTERTYHFHGVGPSGAGGDGQASGQAANMTWGQASRLFASEHPDLSYGQNVALMNQAMRKVSTPQMNSWQILEAGYTKARMMPGWASGAATHEQTSPRRAATTSSTNHVGGLGVSAYARGDIHAVRCTTASGRVYYAKGTCSTSTTTEVVVGHDWHGDKVRGMPGAVMVGPNEAMDPRTGQVVDLQTVSNNTVVHVTTRDHAQSVSADKACAEAQKAEARHPYSHKITRRVQALCQQGRSLYDQKPARGSLYYDGDSDIQ